MDTAVLDTPRAVCGETNAHKLALYLGDRDVPDPIGQDGQVFYDDAVLIEAGTILHTGSRR
ncbi:hypothetical protein ACF1E9_31315 [Streptomyces roseolus]|uniref:hypothetical protein n=1 Tax=Streptomyces TaxID=1883 RepID=UPI0036E25688